MSIKYNSGKKIVFEGYIDKAVNKLKSAESETTGVLKCEFPSKTIIGRRFNKRATISTLKGQINSAYISLSSTKSGVQSQVGEYVKANKKLLGDIKLFDLSLIGADLNSGIIDEKDKKTKSQVNKDDRRYSLNDVKNGLLRTGATVVNGFDALSEGATEAFFGGGEKLTEILGTAFFSPLYAAQDLGTYVMSGGKEKGNILKTKWNQTMENVVEDHPTVTQHKIDHEKEASKKFDKFVYEPFKYEKGGYQVLKGVGGILGTSVGPSVLTGAPVITTAGISSKVVPTLSTGLTAGARGTSEYWIGKKNNSMGGITDKYLRGEISEEQYKSITAIRNMSDKDWKTIEKNMTKKGVDKKSDAYKKYLEMKKIREMPEEWKNDKNLLGGLKYGAATAAWEIAQFKLGSGLSEIVKSPFARIGINTGVNALDPIARAAAMTAIDKSNFGQEFKNQGGTGAVITGGSIGLLGSILGELTELKARKSNTVIDDIDEISNINEQSLKSQILKKVDRIDDEDLKAKAIYEELNKKVHYDMGYRVLDNESKERLISQTMDFDNLPSNNSVVCKGWSELYVELLEDAGIDARVVKSTKRKHWWVEIDLKNGETIIADATDVIGNSIDLVNSKSGKKTNGYIYINNQQKGIDPVEIFNNLDFTEDKVLEIDKKLGYANNKGYKYDQLSKVGNSFPSKVFDKITGTTETEKLIKVIDKIDIPKNMDGYESFGYYLNMGKVGKLDHNMLLYRIGDSGYETVNYISVGNYHQIYSSSLGKKVFSNGSEFVEFFKGLQLNKISGY